jgi:hypothetical protein
MFHKPLLFAALAVIALLAAVPVGRGQVAVRSEAAYNPYTGAHGTATQTYNGYTGTSTKSASGYNPYTGRDVSATAAYNPYTGREAVERSTYNPYTGASTTRAAYGRR